MIFSSLIFLFLFLPLVLISYYTVSDKLKNYVLLLSSILFYAWGEPKYIYLMILSILINYIFGLMGCKDFKNSLRKRKVSLTIAIVFNLSLLIIFKYADFLFGIKGIHLPLGISFFTFQTMSYLVDVYRGDGKVQKNVFNLALYISLFPQLVAGPIIRYETIDKQINNRIPSREKFADGINRFIIGLAKKVILSNQLAVVSDAAFNGKLSDLSIGLSWLGIICYTLQIYFDFGGYSDMAIGLGKMFGFEFLENFNYPYISQTVSEFWRRWHISLGSWFKDYVYIPLGGSKVSKVKLYRNLFIVWILTGVWHGASWNFVVWGLYFGLFIIFEKAFLQKILFKLPKVFRHIYLLFIVVIGWIFFRSNSLQQSIGFIKVMFGIGNNSLIGPDFIKYLNDYWYILFVSIVLSTPIISKTKDLVIKVDEKLIENKIVYSIQGIILTMLMLVVVVLLNSSSYNPFLYFRF